MIQKSILVLIVSVFAFQAQAEDANAHADILQGNQGLWTGTYQVEYYKVIKWNNQFGFKYGQRFYTKWPSTPPAMSIAFTDSADMTPLKSGGDLLSYVFRRNQLGGQETDTMDCNPTGAYPDGATAADAFLNANFTSSGPSLPRQVILKKELLQAGVPKAKVDGFFKAALKDWKTKIYGPRRARFPGLTLWKIDEDAIGLIFGKVCENGVVKNDIVVPIIDMVVDTDNGGNPVSLHMKAVVQPTTHSGNLVQGFSIYNMKPVNPK